MGRSKVLSLFLFLLLPDLLFAQQPAFFVSFKSKFPSIYSIEHPESFLSCRAIENRKKNSIAISENDLPVSPKYLDSLKSNGATILFSSKWLNGAMISATDVQLQSISKLSFVKKVQSIVPKRTNYLSSVQSVGGLQSTTDISDVASYGQSYNQIRIPGVDEMHADGIFGNGVLIAVLDDGFKNVNTLPAFDSLFSFNRIKGTYDFVNNENNVYNDGAGHGTHVLSILAGYSEGNLIGAAWKADFLLLRTENNTNETILEEYNWVRAAEYADSAGADIISSSLGYNDFDNSADNHLLSDLNGDKTVITIGADIAASKGILVVSAAGNEGNSSWKTLLAPADGDSVLTVGGIDLNGNHASFSSTGPTYDGRIKPDVVTLSNSVRVATYTGGYSSGNGTSYATPVISGMAAGLLQKYPHLTNMELLDFIRVSASQYYHPDFEKGYGIPNYKRAVQLIDASKSPLLFPNPTSDAQLHLHWALYQKNQEMEVFYYSITGQLMASEKVKVESPIIPLVTDIQNWKTGVYLVKVHTPMSWFTLKLVRF